MPQLIILAGGEGRRLRPFTFTTPKALLPLATRPMLEHLLQDLRVAGFASMVISGAVDLERRYQGIGGRIPTGMKIRWQKEASTPILSIASAWTEKSSPALVIPADMVLGDAQVYGRLARLLADGSGRGVSVVGQMLSLEPSLIKLFHLGILGLPPSVRPRLEQDGKLDDLVSWYGNDFREIDLGERAPLIGTGAFAEKTATKNGCAWVGVDRPHDLLDAHYVILTRMVAKLRGRKISRAARVAPSAFLKGPVSISKGAVIGEDVRIGRFVWIGEGAQIDHGAVLGDYTMIGPKGRVGPGAKFYGVMGACSQLGRAAEFGGMMMEHVGFPHASHLAGIIGNRTKISVGIVTGTLKLIDPPFRMFVKGKIEKTHLCGVTVGDECFIGAGALLMGGVRIGPFSVVGPGVLVQRDVPPNKMVTRKEEVVWRDIHPDHPIHFAPGEYPPLWHCIPDK